MKVVIIGSGKVATLMGKSLAGAGHTILQVAGRNEGKTKLLARKLNSQPASFYGPVDLTADLYLICVSDNAITEAAKVVKGVKGIVIHTSGTTPLSVLSRYHKSTGVIWPVASIGVRTPNLKNIPLCIEASDKTTENKLLKLAESLSSYTEIADSPTREILHLTAVVTNNFTNYLHNVSFQLLEKHKVHRKILFTLIKNTTLNILDPGPEHSQTGPAVRNDTRTIERHLKLLKKYPDLYKIYASITEGIQNIKTS